MSFSNRMSPCKGPDRRNGARNSLRQGQRKRTTRNIAENRLLAIDCGLAWRARSKLLARRRRDWHWCGKSQCIRHFGKADVSCETHHVQPVRDGKIRERYEDDSGNHKPPRGDLDESKRHRHSRRGDAESDEMCQPGPGAHRAYWSGSLPKESDGGRERAQCVFAVADSKYAG